MMTLFIIVGLFSVILFFKRFIIFSYSSSVYDKKSFFSVNVSTRFLFLSDSSLNTLNACTQCKVRDDVLKSHLSVILAVIEKELKKERKQKEKKKYYIKNVGKGNKTQPSRRLRGSSCPHGV